MEDTGPRSVQCYHDNHEDCPGKAHCGCVCHLQPKKEIDPTAQLQKRIDALEDDKEFYKARVQFLEERVSRETEKVVQLGYYVTALRRGDCWCDVADQGHSAVCRELQKHFE